ncbi:MAG: ABC transporter ATP-binding protein [Candidatus Saccharibacteria bacterium]|nr:ABC transporter ATP-binding protein [Candidatus Saccharibacteria bacterium]
MPNKDASNAIISIRGVTKVYGHGDATVEALRGIDLDINRGESVAIVGKSGSGKSTLTHILATLDKPTTGTVVINGRNSTKMSSRQLNKLRNRTFGFVFQQFYMNARDTVLNNVMLPMVIAGVKRSVRRRRAEEALGTVELTGKEKSRANDLSGGQKQRVCIARAIVNNPSVIFADEPTGNLDSATGDVIEELLFGLKRDKGITLIIVTHDPDLAAKCDRQVYIKDGKIVEPCDEEVGTDDTTYCPEFERQVKAKGGK